MNWYRKGQKMKYEKTLIICRGVSGSGKSTLAQELGKGGVVLSSDDFFTTPTGEYVFDVSKLRAAHDWNQKRAEDAMRNGVSPIVIDNTNTTAKEIFVYVKLGKTYGYDIKFAEPNWHPNLRTPDGKWNFDFINKMQQERNKKNKTKIIPESVVRNMIDRYQYNLTEDDVLKSGGFS